MDFPNIFFSKLVFNKMRLLLLILITIVALESECCDNIIISCFSIVKKRQSALLAIYCDLATHQGWNIPPINREREEERRQHFNVPMNVEIVFRYIEPLSSPICSHWDWHPTCYPQKCPICIPCIETIHSWLALTALIPLSIPRTSWHTPLQSYNMCSSVKSSWHWGQTTYLSLGQHRTKALTWQCLVMNPTISKRFNLLSCLASSIVHTSPTVKRTSLLIQSLMRTTSSPIPFWEPRQCPDAWSLY